MIWLLLLWVVGVLFFWSLARAAREDESEREALEQQRNEAREAERIARTLFPEKQAMKERPLLMSGPLVVKTLADLKTQTRRLVRWPVLGPDLGGKRRLFTSDDVAKHRAEIISLCPHGQPRDRLWVRETTIIAPPNFSGDDRNHQHVIDSDGRPRLIQYLATAPDREGADNFKLKATPSIFMPRWASRLTLEIAEIRVERLQDISEEDAKAEGVTPYTPPHGCIHPDQRVPGPGFDGVRLGDQPHRLAFADLWDSINGDRANWESNPWVWCLAFRRIEVRS